jgi:hypothetical protein
MQRMEHPKKEKEGGGGGGHALGGAETYCERVAIEAPLRVVEIGQVLSFLALLVLKYLGCWY